jgi:hypothetical protein
MAYLLKHKNGNTIIHCSGAIQGDVSLCGHDLAGDGDLGHSEATWTKRPINCKDCKAIIEFCKSIPSELIAEKSVSVSKWRSEYL